MKVKNMLHLALWPGEMLACVHKGDLPTRRRQAELIASRLPAGNVQAVICCGWLPLWRQPSKQVACNMRLLPNVCRMLSRLCLCGTLPVACNSTVERLCKSFVCALVCLPVHLLVLVGLQRTTCWIFHFICGYFNFNGIFVFWQHLPLCVVVSSSLIAADCLAGIRRLPFAIC